MANDRATMARPEVEQCIQNWRALVARYPEFATLESRADLAEVEAPPEYLAHCRQVVDVQSRVRSFDFTSWLRLQG